jgi:RecA-family ATPase
MPQPKWLIEGLFEANSLIMLAGAAASFKSFLLLDWLLCMASGRKWCNKKTQACKVGYVLGEGKASLIKRIQSWIKYTEPSDEEMESLRANFRVTFEVPQLVSKASVDNMLADLEQEGFKPEVIAVDTFARSFVGQDENDAKDTGLWIESADRLRQLGYSVIFLHHTKKNTEFGVHYRGSTAIMGAMDTAMTLTREANNSCTLQVSKQKDHDEGPPMKFRRVMVSLGADSSCVLVPQAPIIDSRFTEEALNFDENEAIASLLEDATFESDRARARELVKIMKDKGLHITESGAQTKIFTAAKKHKKF